MAVSEWDQRQLCPDGGCVGLIGPDGTCKVCGHVMPNWGDERMRGLADAPEEPDEDEDDLDDDDAAEGDEPPAEWEERKLCDDGACVGVIGDNGLCTVCGKRSAA